MRQKFHANNSGISLFELIIVVLIIGILCGGLIPSLFFWIRQAKQAKDIETAERIAQAVTIAFATHPEAKAAFDGSKDLKAKVTATVDGQKEEYSVYLIVTNEGPIYCFKGGMSKFGKSDGSTGFYGTLNNEMGLSTKEVNKSIMPRTKLKSKSDQVGNPGRMRAAAEVDRWRIVRRADNNQMEIWSAQPDPYGGFPVYRVWPKADDIYYE